MSTLHITQESVFLNALRTRIVEKLGKDFKIALPEWDRIDVKIAVETDIVSGRLKIRVDFLFDPNGLS